MKEQTFTCEICSQSLSRSEHMIFDGQKLCSHCLEVHTLLCSECGERLWANDNAGSRDTPLCQECYDDNYTTCSRCGSLFRESEAYYENSDEYDERPYCSSCFHSLAQDGCIHDYYYKPEAIFYGEGPRYFGVELELDNGGECTAHANALLKIANQEGAYAYIKHNGSLSDGLEVVTHPLSLEYQLHRMPWERLCGAALSMGYVSHQASTCGLHVHISRQAFGKTERSQDAAIARVLYFFEKHWEELLKFSRRTPRQLERWAARYGYKEQPMELLDYAKKGGHGGRYTCVNLQNRDTVEFRMFRGTLKPNTIFATLELLDRICDLAVCLSDEELKAVAWTSFVGGIQREACPELVQYLKERQLYVNEPVESEVEK